MKSRSRGTKGPSLFQSRIRSRTVRAIGNSHRASDRIGCQTHPIAFMHEYEPEGCVECSSLHAGRYGCAWRCTAGWRQGLLEITGVIGGRVDLSSYVVSITSLTGNILRHTSQSSRGPLGWLMQCLRTTVPHYRALELGTLLLMCTSHWKGRCSVDLAHRQEA